MLLICAIKVDSSKAFDFKDLSLPLILRGGNRFGGGVWGGYSGGQGGYGSVGVGGSGSCNGGLGSNGWSLLGPQ